MNYFSYFSFFIFLWFCKHKQILCCSYLCYWNSWSEFNRNKCIPTASGYSCFSNVHQTLYTRICRNVASMVIHFFFTSSELTCYWRTFIFILWDKYKFFVGMFFCWFYSRLFFFFLVLFKLFFFSKHIELSVCSSCLPWKLSHLALFTFSDWCSIITFSLALLPKQQSSCYAMSFFK